MSNSAQGKPSKYSSDTYILYKHPIPGRPYRIYQSHSSTRIGYTDFYNLYLSKTESEQEDIKIIDSDGKCHKASILRQAHKTWMAHQNGLKTKAKKQKGKEALMQDGGYYCDCKLSSTYKRPQLIPLGLPLRAYDAISTSTRVSVNKNQECLFCGYTAFYSEFKPHAGRPKRSSL